MSQAEIADLRLDEIRIDGKTQPREQIDLFTVSDYSEAMKAGAIFPPVEVVHDGKHYWLWDGFHRWHGGKQAGRLTITCRIQNGTADDARWLALGANQTHGLRRTNADKRRAVEEALRMKPQMSDRAIAEHCGVSHQFVCNMRTELELSVNGLQMPETRTVTRGGSIYTIDTSNIGKPKAIDPQPQRDDIPGPLPGMAEFVPPPAPPRIELPTVPTQQGGRLGKPGEFITLDDWNALAKLQRIEALNVTESDRKMNDQGDNENIEWALWSWNPVTGCLHECPYCYARDIANRFYEPRFAPTIWPARLLAPLNTTFPETKAKEWMGHKNVFTCSMADLFGRWVPSEWIEAVLEVVRKAKQWNFLFLTKFPNRMAEFTFPANAWVGTSVDCQSRVANAEKAFRKIRAGVKWLSCEPLLEPLEFSDIGAFDWLVLGGASRSSETPEWRPPWQWVATIMAAAANAGVRVYQKTNLLTEGRVREYPTVPAGESELPVALRYLPQKH